MDATSSSVPAAAHGEPWLARHVPPDLDLTPFTPAELYEWFQGGEPEADEGERLLACASRARGGIDVVIAELLHALRQGDRLAELGFRLDDYAREVLDLGKRSAESLARLGGEDGAAGRHRRGGGALGRARGAANRPRARGGRPADGG